MGLYKNNSGTLDPIAGTPDARLAQLDQLETQLGNHTVAKDVPSDAVFTDSWRPVVNNLTSTSTTSSLSANQGKVLNDKITDLNNDLSVKDITYGSGISVKKMANLIVIFSFGGIHKDSDAILPSNSPYKPASNIVVAGFNASSVARCGIRTDGTLIFTAENGSAITSSQQCFFALAYTI